MILRRSLLVFATTLLLLALVDGGILLLAHRGGMDHPVDIQHRATLYLQLERLRDLPGRKAVFLGDSVVVGRSLARHHTIPAVVQAGLTASRPHEGWHSVNLAIDGAVPMDLLRLTELVLPLRPDLLVIDVNLRSLSMDFAPPDQQYARPWLRDLVPAADGVPAREVSEGGGFRATAQDFLLRHWRLYRSRNYLLQRWLLPPPRDAEAEGDFMILLLKAKSRYHHVTLDDHNPQWQALGQLVARLTQDRQPAVLFYANENPGVVAELLPPERLAALRATLFQRVDRALPHYRFVPPVAALKEDHFLDQIHLTVAGTKKLVEEALLPAIRQVLP